MSKLKQECLDKAARESGYKDFNEARRYAAGDGFNSIVRQAMDIYAEEQAKKSALVKSTKYQIDFGGHIMCRVVIKDNTPTFTGAVSGHGNSILDKIVIDKLPNRE